MEKEQKLLYCVFDPIRKALSADTVTGDLQGFLAIPMPFLFRLFVD